MGDEKDDTAAPPPEPKSPDESRRSGRVGRDARGNAVWEWQLETGVYSRDVNTQKIRKLDLNDLSIAETAKLPQPGPAEPADPHASRGGGFNPYDSTPARERGGNPYDNAQSGGTGTAPPPREKTAAPRKPADLRKLDEWVKLKRRLKDD